MEAPDAEPQPLRAVDFEYTVRPDLTQASLFTADQLAVPQRDVVVPQRLRELKKSIAAIHAVPMKGDDTYKLNTRRLFDALILFAQIDVRSRPPGFLDRLRDPREPIMPIFEARVSELCKLAGISPKNQDRVYADLKDLLNMQMSWNIVGEDSKVEFELTAHLMTHFGRGTGAKRGIARFAIEPSILLLVLDPNTWATLSLEVLTGLKTSSSYALYQNVWRYMGTKNGVTAPLPVETWIELLLGPSRFVKVDSEGRKVVEGYGEFKARYLLDAIERVNSVKALAHTIELVELKSGRRVSRLQFRFVRKRQERLELPLTWPTEVLQPLTGFGYSEEDIAALSEAHSMETMRETLLRFDNAKKRLAAKGATMGHPRRYFEGILQNVAAGQQESAQETERIEAAIRSEEAQKAAEALLERNQARFNDHRDARFREALAALEASRRGEILADFESSDAFGPCKVLLPNGWELAGRGAYVMLRNWLERARPETLTELLPQPQDRSLEGWLNWRAAQAE